MGVVLAKLAVVRVRAKFCTPSQEKLQCEVKIFSILLRIYLYCRAYLYFDCVEDFHIVITLFFLSTGKNGGFLKSLSPIYFSVAIFDIKFFFGPNFGLHCLIFGVKLAFLG